MAAPTAYATRRWPALRHRLVRRGRSARLMQLVGRAAGQYFLLRRSLRPATLPAASTRLSSIFGVRHLYEKPGVSLSYRHRFACGLPLASGLAC